MTTDEDFLAPLTPEQAAEAREAGYRIALIVAIKEACEDLNIRAVKRKHVPTATLKRWLSELLAGNPVADPKELP
jgi:hypothetical protein